MRASTLVKAATWVAFLAGMSVAGIKYVAVVESDVDEASGASEKISRADVRLVTAELRREAVKNLPPKRYVIMTAETVMAQGGAVLEECADENCVITLGSKIGADYIVRGTVSKLGAKFTLQVEMYETENGNLVASCDPVRSESIRGLVEKAAEACANMYKAWLASQAPEPEQTVEKSRKKYIGANYTLVNSPPVTSTVQPSMNNITYKWVNIESGWMTGFGLFFGAEGGLGFGTSGYDKEVESTIAFGFSLDAGYTFRLPAGFALSPGGTIGIWFQHYENVNKFDSIEFNTVSFFGLFVKTRWKFIEVSYKGIIGFPGNEIITYSEDGSIEERLKDESSQWVNQVKAGVYIEF
jgi:hypothetical protein